MSYFMNHKKKTAFDELISAHCDDSHIGHGEHWRIFFDDLDELASMLPLIGQVAEPLMTCADDENSCPLPFSEEEPVGDLVAWPNTERGMIQLHQKTRQSEVSSIASAYPWVSDGVTHMAKIEGIRLWPDRLEALIDARIGDGMAVTFFDPLFIKNRVFYRKGGFYPMVFSAIAYEFRVYDPATEGQEFSVDIQKNKTCRLIQEENVLDNSVFIGEVVNVKTVRFFDAPVSLVRVTIGQMVLPFNEKVDIEMIVTDGALGFSRGPDIGDTVYGRIWLTAYLRAPKTES